MRVLIFHPALPPYRLHLFNALSERFNMKLIFLRMNLLNQKFDQDRLRNELKAEHDYLTGGLTIRGRTIRLGVWREIDTFLPDIVVTHDFSPTTLAVILKKKASTTQFRHVVWTDDNLESESMDNKFRRLLRHYVLKNIHGLIVLSEEIAERYQLLYGVKSPIGFLPIVYNEEIFLNTLWQSTEKAKSYVSAYDLMGKQVVLFVGRLVPEKRVDRLLEAFAGIHDAIPNAMLVLVGDGPERSKLEALAKASGIEEKTVFTGRLEDASLYAWYILGGLFVLPSQFEAFGAVVNEALLAGMPVVCSDRAGARVLIQDGVNGTVVDALDQVGLQSAIYEWLLRASPLEPSILTIARPPLMRTTFQQAVDGFVSLLEAVNKNTASVS